MVSSRARVLPPQQWEQHKRDIVKLYLDKKYTLKVVREKLAKRGFHATEGQFRTRLKRWGIRKPRQGIVVTAPDASTGGQNDSNLPAVDASVTEDGGAMAVKVLEDSKRSASTVTGSQPSLEERDQAFLMNAAIAPEELYIVSHQIMEPSSFRTRYDHAGNEARASQPSSCSTRSGLIGNEARTSQTPSYSTRNDLVGIEVRTSQTPSYSMRYGLVDNEARNSQSPPCSTRYSLVENEARTPQAPSRSTRHGLVDNEAHTSQALPSFQYSSSGSDAQHHASPFGLQYEASASHSGFSLGLSLEQHGDSLADENWNPTELINSQPDTASRYG